MYSQAKKIEQFLRTWIFAWKYFFTRPKFSHSYTTLKIIYHIPGGRYLSGIGKQVKNAIINVRWSFYLNISVSVYKLRFCCSFLSRNYDDIDAIIYVQKLKEHLNLNLNKLHSHINGWEGSIYYFEIDWLIERFFW